MQTAKGCWNGTGVAVPIASSAPSLEQRVAEMTVLAAAGGFRRMKTR